MDGERERTRTLLSFSSLSKCLWWLGPDCGQSRGPGAQSVFFLWLIEMLLQTTTPTLRVCIDRNLESGVGIWEMSTVTIS